VSPSRAGSVGGTTGTSAPGSSAAVTSAPRDRSVTTAPPYRRALRRARRLPVERRPSRVRL